MGKLPPGVIPPRDYPLGKLPPWGNSPLGNYPLGPPPLRFPPRRFHCRAPFWLPSSSKRVNIFFSSRDGTGYFEGFGVIMCRLCEANARGPGRAASLMAMSKSRRCCATDEASAGGRLVQFCQFNRGTTKELLLCCNGCGKYVPPMRPVPAQGRDGAAKAVRVAICDCDSAGDAVVLAVVRARSHDVGSGAHRGSARPEAQRLPSLRHGVHILHDMELPLR